MGDGQLTKNAAGAKAGIGKLEKSIEALEEKLDKEVMDLKKLIEDNHTEAIKFVNDVLAIYHSNPKED